jgi:glycosyltransferase involved in cell wall biosynthesis
VCVGGLNPHKNLLGVLESLERVLLRVPDIHLAIVGETSGEGFFDNVADLKQRVDQSKTLKRHVHFTGYISDDDLATLYSCATALVQASFWEGFGLPAVEVMSCGLPVLASCRGSLPEVAGDAGTFFDPGSIDEMTEVIAAAIGGFVEHPDQWQAASLRALARSQTFSWERGAELAEASFRRALELEEDRT